ncbi:MAG: cupredoxin domain-containing protein [Candidatus Methylomirabilia bacterium]
MNAAQASVTLVGLGLSVLIAWYFWFSEKTGIRAEAAGGVQEAKILVKGGYTPDVIVVKAGTPVRLTFLRQETAACSEMVVFGDFNRSAKLPEGAEVPIEFTPDKPGEYDFACQMGMLRGKVIAE